MNWYYAKNGSQQGPISTEALKEKIASGEVSAADLAWREGLPDWAPAGTIEELKPAQPVATASTASADPVSTQPTTPYQTPASAPAPAPYQAPVPGQVPSAGLAIGSMVCGIVALLLCCVWIISVPLGIVAVVMGHVAASRIKAQPAQYGGAGMAKAGLITGYLAILLTIVYTVFIFVVVQNPDKWPLPPEVKEKLQEQREMRERIRHGEPVTNP